MGFVEDFVAWGRSRSDAPQPFLEACALFTVSASCGDRLRARTSIDGDMSLAEYFFLSGETSSRKTWVLNLAQEVLHTVLPTRALPAMSTPEAYAEHLQRCQGQGFVIYDEFSRFFKEQESKPYMAGMLEQYADDWSRKYAIERARAGKAGSIILPRAFVPMAVATTNRQLADVLTAESVGLGFLGRFVMVHAERGPRRHIDESASGEEELRDIVLARLYNHQAWLASATRAAPARLHFSRGALEVLNAWADAWDTGMATAHPIEASMNSKREDHCLRLAALLHVSDALMTVHGIVETRGAPPQPSARDAGRNADRVPDPLLIGEEHVTRAARLVDRSIRGWSGFAPYASGEEFALRKAKLLAEVERRGGEVWDRDLFHAMDWPRRAYEDVVGALEYAGIVQAGDTVSIVR